MAFGDESSQAVLACLAQVDVHGGLNIEVSCVEGTPFWLAYVAAGLAVVGDEAQAADV